MIQQHISCMCGHISNNTIIYVFHSWCHFYTILTHLVDVVLYEMQRIRNILIEAQIENFMSFEKEIECLDSIETYRHLKKNIGYVFLYCVFRKTI